MIFEVYVQNKAVYAHYDHACQDVHVQDLMEQLLNTELKLQFSKNTEISLTLEVPCLLQPNILI